MTAFECQRGSPEDSVCLRGMRGKLYVKRILGGGYPLLSGSHSCPIALSEIYLIFSTVKLRESDSVAQKRERSLWPEMKHFV
jgi:hypothetical protein